MGLCTRMPNGHIVSGHDSSRTRSLSLQKQRPSLLLKLLRPGKRTGHEYRAIWISQRELQDEGIILSGRMMAGV